MIADVLIAAAVLIVGIIVAFFRGKAKQRNEYEIDKHNEYVATRKRIEAATNRDLSNADVADSLRKHAKR